MCLNEKDKKIMIEAKPMVSFFFLQEILPQVHDLKL